MFRLLVVITLAFFATVVYRLLWIYVIQPILDKEKDDVGKSS